MEEHNSFRSFVQDDLGQTFLFTTGTNRPELVESTKAHARWWIGYARKAAARGERTRQGQRIEAPVGCAKIIVEFYSDETGKPKRRKKRV